MGFVSDYLNDSRKVLFRPDEVAFLLQVSIRTVRRWANEGSMLAVRTEGGHFRIPKEALLRFGATPNY